MRWIPLAAIGIVLGSAVAYAQIINPGGGGGTPGGSATQLQFNTASTFGGISGVTSDSANVGFATNSQLILYGFTTGDCVKIGTSNQLADSGGACGGSGAPGGINTQVQFNTGGTFGGISGATSNGSNISFTTNNLVINGQAISKVSGTTGTLASVTGALASNCVQGDGNGNLITTGVPCATQTATPSIAAGSNITTSGTSANTTVNVVATPSFTTVIASGNLTAGTAQFAGFLTAGGASISGLNLATGTISGNLTGATANFSGNLTGTTVQFTGLLTGTNAVFQTVTVSNLTPTGPNCLQETGGVLQATNVPCASQVATVSIAAGNNITTSGTASNVTVTATPTGASNTVQYNNAGVFGGDSGFQYAGGSAGIVTHTLGTLITTNGRALSLVGAWSNSTTTFAAPLFVNITTNTSSANTTSGFGVGSRLVDIQATSLSVLSISPSGAMSSAALQSAATQCLQASTGGLVFGTAVPCATQTSTPSIAAGTNITTSGTAANTTVNVVATPSFTTVIATGNLTASTAQFSGFLTAGGASLSGLTIATETLSSNLTGTTANFSSNLTANIAQFAGFLSAGGTSLSGLTIQTATFSSNLTGTTANFSSNLTANIAQFAGFLTAGGASLSGLTIQTETLTGALNGSTGNFTSILTASIYAGTPTGAGMLSFVSPSVSQFQLAGGTNAATPATGWLNWGGESRLSADKAMGINSAALTPSGLSVSLQGGRTYSVDADIYITTTAATGGIQLALTGTYGSADTHYFGYVVDGGAVTGAGGTFENVRGAVLSTAKNTVIGNVVLSGTTGYASIKGTITASGSGTLVVAASQINTVTVPQTTLTRGSRILVHDMP